MTTHRRAVVLAVERRRGLRTNGYADAPVLPLSVAAFFVFFLRAACRARAFLLLQLREQYFEFGRAVFSQVFQAQMWLRPAVIAAAPSLGESACLAAALAAAESLLDAAAVLAVAARLDDVEALAAPACAGASWAAETAAGAAGAVAGAVAAGAAAWVTAFAVLGVAATPGG